MIRTLHDSCRLTSPLPGALWRQACCQNWPQWRGPNFNGSSEAKDTPALVDHRECQMEDSHAGRQRSNAGALGGQDLRLLARQSHQRPCGNVSRQEHRRGPLAETLGRSVSPTKAAARTWRRPRRSWTATRVFFMFGTTDLFALDFEGNTLWHRNIERTMGRSTCFSATIPVPSITMAGCISRPFTAVVPTTVRLPREWPIRSLRRSIPSPERNS